MRAMTALWKREYLEHRGPFLYAPIAIILVLALTLGLGLGFGKFRVPFQSVLPAPDQLFEMVLLGLAALWWYYLALMLFFYFADAFSADRRNNSMFFWKSMPQSDLKILLSKFLAGLVVFPVLIFVAMLASGLLLYLFIAVLGVTQPRFASPDFAAMTASFGQVGVLALVYFALALLWFAPFLAWVGGLSTLVGRWAIPLAFVIPSVLILLENVLFFGEGPNGGRIAQFLNTRLEFGFDHVTVQQAFLSDMPIDAPALIGSLLGRIDWAALGIGLGVTAVLLYGAGEYRRRVIAA